MQLDFDYVFHEPSMATLNYSCIQFIHKPVVIYQFIDPFCYQTWKLELMMKKLNLHYGLFFNVRPIIRPTYIQRREKVSYVRSFSNWEHYHLTLAIKTASLQGNKKGKKFLRHLQENIFLYEMNNPIDELIHLAAERAELDLDEFYNDFQSQSSLNAYRCDVELIQEMQVTQFPTLVFFSELIEDYNIKTSGLQSYETYAYLLEKLLHMDDLYPIESENNQIEHYLQKYPHVQTEEIAFIFDLTKKEAELQLKQLQLKRKLTKNVVNGKTIWEYDNLGQREPSPS